LPDDPAGAIGAAKQLVEATAKVVLTERRLPVAGDAAQQALHLHPSSILPGRDSSEAVKKILGGVSSIAVGVAELRNRGYGSGHGHASTSTGRRKQFRAVATRFDKLGVRYQATIAVADIFIWLRTRPDQPRGDPRNTP